MGDAASMRRRTVFNVAVVMSVIAVTSLGCERHSDVITETSPFLTVIVSTPADGGAGIQRRAEQFASGYGMRILYSDQHFSPGEYSVRLLRPDFNIAADNVLRDKQSVVSVYANRQPTAEHRNEANEYLCQVMLHGC